MFNPQEVAARILMAESILSMARSQMLLGRLPLMMENLVQAHTNLDSLIEDLIKLGNEEEPKQTLDKSIN